MAERQAITIAARPPKKRRSRRLPAKKKSAKKSISQPEPMLATISW
jgi:hypothetical protein